MPREPSVRNRRIGMELRKMREERNLTLRAAGRLLERSPGSLSGIENGQGVRARDLEYILGKYGIEDPAYREALLELARTARKSGWWHRHTRDLSPAAMDFISLEADANLIQTYEIIAIPGLLQTPDYASVLIEAGEPPDGVERAVGIRIARQHILARPDAARFHFVVGEAALRYRVGGAEVMRAQLRRLLEISENDHVTIQVLPFEAGGHPGFSGPFTIVEIGTRGKLRVVRTQTPERMSYVEDVEDVRRFCVRFDRLSSAALPEADTQVLIHRIRSEL